MRSRSIATHQVIHIQPQAAAKPPAGAPCNGCGICCLAEPCPLGVLLSRRRVGPCQALRWVEDLRQYRCAALGDATDSWRARLVARWIGAGSGCDCDLEPLPSPTIEISAKHEQPPA